MLWVVGANPLKDATIASTGAFVIVQDLFLTETAPRADILFPAASAYEKHGTVTNVCGEVQRLKGGVQVMGAKPDLEIIGLLSKEMGVNLGMWSADKVFEEIRKNVHGYNIPLPVLATGGAAQTAPVNGRVPVSSRPELIQSARRHPVHVRYLGPLLQEAEFDTRGAGRVVFRAAPVKSP